MKITKPILDDPIADTSEDLLERRAFAASVASLIEAAPEGSSFRVGVYGDWGEGKTSVLSLVEQRLEKLGYATGWIFPWTSTSSFELREALIYSIAKSAELHRLTLWIAGLRARFGGIGSTIVSEGDWKAKVASAVFRGVFPGALLSRIRKALEKRKVVVFVDDLDRATPEIVPEFLLVLREAVDFPNLFFVVGLSPDVVRDALGDQHPGWGDAHQFLEKIIEFHRYVPEPDEATVRRFAASLAEQLGEGVIDSNALASVEPLLSTNPRQLKLFLRFLASASPLLRRFAPEEIDLGAFYVCALLLVEFPEEARALAADGETLREIESSWTRPRAAFPLQDDADEVKPEAKYAPSGNDGRRERFLDLCSSLRHKQTFFGRYSLADLFGLLHQPPAITLKEASAIVDEVGAGETDPSSLLREWIDESQETHPDATAQLFRVAVEIRQAILGRAADEIGEDETLARLEVADAATKVLKTLVSDLGVFRSGELGADSWMKLYYHVAGWSHWVEPPYYRDVREAELSLLRDSATDIPQALEVAVRQDLERERHHLVQPVSPAFEQLSADFKERFAMSVVDALLASFEQPDGPDRYWGNTEAWLGESYLFEPGSPFHSPEARQRLLEIAGRAPDEPVVHKNFLWYFRMVAHTAFEAGGPVTMEVAQNLLRDGRFGQELWKAAVARSLNQRVVGSLLQQRAAMLEVLGVELDELAAPLWLQRMEAVFDREAAIGQGDDPPAEEGGPV